MRAFFGEPRKINLGCTGNRCSSSPTVLKNVLNKKRKIKHVPSKSKAPVIILQVFVFDKTYLLVPRDSALMHPESSPSVHTRMHCLKVYFFVSCFLTMPLNRTKLQLKLRTHEKIYMDDWA